MAIFAKGKLMHNILNAVVLNCVMLSNLIKKITAVNMFLKSYNLMYRTRWSFILIYKILMFHDPL